MSHRCLFTIAALLLFPSIVFAAYEVNNTQAAAWLSAQQNTDGSWGANAREHFLYTVEAVQSLRAAGQRNGAYFKGITWLENHAADNADYGARRALALATHGDDVSSVIALLDAQQNTAVTGRDGWGLSDSYHQSPLDSAIVLNSLSALPTNANVQAGIDYLKSAQLGGANPGWPVASETVSDAFATALVVRTLAVLQAQDPTVATPIANGLNALNTSVVSGSPAYLQALAAHAALLAGNTTAAQNWLAMLVSGQGGDGSWSGRIYDTALAMRALAAADGTDSAANQAAVSIPDKNLRAAVNYALGRNAMDSLDRSELLRLTDLSAVGMSISDLTGLEWALNLQTADLRNNNITSTSPIDGLAQLAAVLLDGNPIVVASVDEDIPTLPEWGVIIMAALLLISAARRQRANRREALQA
ncbi:MAG TPA: IPTL-CTERM sorting domain-containing protein [Gammaproteobacteria bacterium]